jgi:hypothetical protein
MRRDWLPNELPSGLEFGLFWLPATFGVVSNATITIVTNSVTPDFPRQSASFNRSNGFLTTFWLETGTNYTILMSTNLNDWLQITNFVCSCASNTFADLAATNYNKGFYRTISQ